MKTYRSGIWIAALALSFIFARGQETPSEASVRELLSVSGARAASGELFAEMERVTEMAMRGLARELAHEDGGEEILTELSTTLGKIMREELAWEKLEPMYVEVYRDVFTQEEIDGLVAFYGSPVGRAYVAKQPQIVERTTALLEPRTGPIMARVNRAVAEAMITLEERHGDGHGHSHGHEDPQEHQSQRRESHPRR